MKQSYTVVLDWMLDLGLSPVELLCFATIYGFCQDGECAFTGSRAYLARKMGAASKRTVDGVLSRLIERCLILKSEKSINGIKFCEYRVNFAAVQDCTRGASAAPATGANPAPNNKDTEKKVSISSIARELCPNFGDEFYQLLATLATEKKWKNKSENAWRLSLKKLAGVPEIEACEMIRRTIAGGWQGIFELDARDKAALYAQKSPLGGYRPQGGPAVQPMPKSGVMGSEALVQAALAEFEN